MAENENTVCQLAHRKHGTVQIKDFTYVLKYLKDGKGPKIVQNYANTTQMFYHRTSAKTHSLIARMCIAPKQVRIIGTGYFQDLFVMRRRDS